MAGQPRRLSAIGVRQRGQALIEAAIAFPLLILIALGLVQFALYSHARNVVVGAVQDGARLAAAEDRTVGDGVGRAQALLQAGLGSAGDVVVGGREDGETVVVEARGGLRMIIPWVADATLPLAARSVVSKERFRAGARG